ncbi:MAG: hypothetical protein ACOX63_10145 [Christensenellales bacterium]|jgi:hypothetical protein
MSKAKMKPIIFSTPMVRAIMEGRKTMTRRVMKPQPIMDDGGMWHWKDCQWMDGGLGFPASGIDDYAPYKPGDTMWVKETWQHVDNGDENSGYVYKASENGKAWEKNAGGWKWRPSIFMPREAARIFLWVTDVYAERLQDITEEYARVEGIRSYWKAPHNRESPFFWDEDEFYKGNDKASFRKARDAFRDLWDSINAKRGYGWESNPWVFVYAFERITECCRCGKIEDCNDGLCEQCEFELMQENAEHDAV